MELAIPLVALGSLYVINNQKKPNSGKNKEGFANRVLLPNSDIPDANYSPTQYDETTYTSKLSTVNKYNGGAYTDKYFSADSGSQYSNNSVENKDSTYYSLTGNKVDKDYFQHNNMVPFFGSTVRSTFTDSNTNESILDNMTGTGSQQIKKSEQAPLFAPSENYQWAYGAPNQSDFMQSRVNPSMRMANVKPFAEQQVAPGLGLGYTTDGAGGFNSGMMMRDAWSEKTVDQLRVDNKQKASGLMMLGHEGPAMSRITNLGSIGQVEKNRPDRHFESFEGRLFTTTGASKGPMLNAIPIDRHVNRPDTTVSYVGGAGHNVESSYVPGEYKPSTNIDLGVVPIGIANANGRNYAHDSEYGIKSSKAYMNNRVANKSDQYFGGLGGVIGAAVAPLMDVLRPSRKENTIGTLRPYQNAKSTAGGQSYLFNPNDRMAPTIRETTENSKFHLNINANQRGGAYEVSDHQVAYTNRQTTDNFYYAGGASAGERGREARPYDAEYRQRNNDIKSSTIDGRLVPGNMSLMNGDINMRQVNRDAMFKNNRPVAPSMPYQSPSVHSMGELQGNSGLYSTIQMDRTSPEILNSLQGNPYALSVTNGL
jgi:hypothetical protein